MWPTWAGTLSSRPTRIMQHEQVSKHKIKAKERQEMSYPSAKLNDEFLLEAVMLSYHFVNNVPPTE